MPKILVTGGSGFVGSALCRTLGERNISFVSSVRRKTAPFQYETGDLTPSTKWSGALSGCDVIIHLAARVHVMNDTTSDPLRDYREMNVDVTLNLARQAFELGARRFVFVSSIKVNGEATTDQPFKATDAPHPVDPYGQSKLEAERALQAFCKSTGMELVIIRPPLVYGPGVGANFRRLMGLVKRGLPLPFKNIQNRRSMVALDNLVDLLIVCAFHPKAAGQTFMVSDGNDLSISGLITCIGHSMNKVPVLFPVPMGLVTLCARLAGKANVAGRLFGSLQVDIADTKATLDWHPVISTDAAIQKTVASFLTQGQSQRDLV